MIWEKLGNIFDPTKYNDGIERVWMKSHSQSVSTQVFKNFVRVYFSCRPEIEDDGQYRSYTSFVDLDRNNLKQILRVSDNPVMKLGDLGTFDEFAVYPTSTIRVDNNIFLYYAGWTRCKSTPYTVSIGLAISDDGGTNFIRYSKGPILTNSIHEPYEISGPKIRKFNDTWFLYYLAGEGWTVYNNKVESTYKIRMAMSEDGIEWKKLNKNIIETVLEDGECQAGPDVFFKDGLYHMYFSFRHSLDYKNKIRGYKIGYAQSVDGINWVRNDSLSGIELSKTGWDSEMLHYPHVFEVDGQWYMLYNGNDFGRYGFGLAKLKL